MTNKDDDSLVSEDELNKNSSDDLYKLEEQAILEEEFSEPAIPGGLDMADEEATEAEQFEKGAGANRDPEDIEDYGMHIE